MKNRYLLIWLILLHFTKSGYGQNNYQAGYIITHNNDTIKGWINLKSNYQNNRSCEFTENKNQVPKIYSPDDIKAYRIEKSKYYLSREVTLNNTKQRVFLEYLIDGIVDLFYLRDVLNDYYFMGKDSLITLSNDLVKVFREGDGLRTNDKEFLMNSNQYQGVLRYLFYDGNLANRISGTLFEYKSLINITKDYHNRVCNDYECIDYTRSTTRILFIEPSVGVISSWTGLKTSKDHVYEIKPYYGIQLRFKPIKIDSSWNFLVGVNYSTNNTEGDFEDKLFTTPTLPVSTHHIYTKYSILRIPLTVEYALFKRRFQPFLSLSYVNIFLINTDYEVFWLYEGTSVPKKTAFRKYQIGMSAGAGFKVILRNGSHFFLKNDFEYRIPSANNKNILDYYRTKSWLISFGYGFKL